MPARAIDTTESTHASKRSPVPRPRGRKTATAPKAELTHSPSTIQVRGARVHNLKNLDVDLPRDRLVVLTGVSGSGKSSLAFDTIYAEGQRRYLECLSSYARQFLDQLERPDVDSIEGLPPTVAIDQRRGMANPRSTLGTVTEIYDYLRLLFAKIGKPHCPACGLAIHRQTPEQMVAELLRLREGQKVQILAPLVRDRKGQHLEVFQAIRRAGLIRARVDGEMIEVTDQPPKLAKARSHSIEAVVDRISVREGVRPRIAESLDLALKLSGGGVLTLTESAGGWVEHFHSIHLSCPNCGTGLPTIEPRTFSFNSPHGACPACQGLGSQAELQPELAFVEEKKHAPAARQPAAIGQDEVLCVACGGFPPSRRRRVLCGLDGRSIADLSALSVLDLLTFFAQLRIDPTLEAVGSPLAAEIVGRLRYLIEVGLGYLSLGRGSDTLSGGELQRARLAAQLGSGLMGVCVVLDEPTAGLHPRDTDRLITSIRRLLQEGNSVVVVEHDESMIKAADWIVDLGPGAGPDGGCVVAAGTSDQLRTSSASITGRYLGRRLPLAAGAGTRLETTPGWIEIHDASLHNLKHVNVKIPQAAFTCVTGVSGSGKSTLVHDVLAHRGSAISPGNRLQGE